MNETNESCYHGVDENDISKPGIVIMFLLSAITIVGNIITIIVIVTKKSLLNNPGNRFILSLSMADCFVGLFVMIPSTIRILVKSCLKYVITLYLILYFSMVDGDSG